MIIPFTMAANKQQQSQIKNLIMLALADGKATESELALIASIASREQLTEKQLGELIENPDSLKMELPQDDATKKSYLADMVALMTIDGDMDDNELAMCKVYAMALGYNSSEVEKLVVEISNQLAK